MSTANAPTSGAEPESAAARATALLEAAAGEPARYAMFEIDELTAEGAFLACGLWLEVGEEITLELAGAGSEARALRARVIEISREPRPGMRVTFLELGDDDRALIDKLAAG